MGNGEVLRRLLTAFAERDVAAMAERLAEDVRWHTPGSSKLAGNPEGREAVLAQLAKSGQLSGGTYRVELVDLLEGEDHAAMVYRGTATREGRSLDLLHLGLYRIAGGRVQEVWIEPLDQEAFDAFWA